jgi:hypothetical protein
MPPNEGSDPWTMCRHCPLPLGHGVGVLLSRIYRPRGRHPNCFTILIVNLSLDSNRLGWNVSLVVN